MRRRASVGQWPTDWPPMAMSRLVWPGVHRRIFRDRFHEVDVADRAATTVTLEHIVVEAAVGAVVNNVGFARFGVIGSIELDHLFDTYDLSAYRSAGRAGRAAGHARPGMGRIVYVTTLTTLGTPERTPYAAAKAALETCTRIWANELASTGITVNAVAPGPTETEMYRQRSPVGQSAKLGFCRAFRCKGSVPG
ncbi:short chain dehydrogenase family protein [Mycobacterium xenopi 4042]|uniref:Short chain dehydrogenase family protein n=1 Tax=Mycobacterium xenopi 4042 TaxID=1299334 RepID=X8BG23_MYCXE|nr:short chain dehydrogenase family protein [Mycobacterium xenopi 3993]EUA42416.1 short chain dehydrogenase family protein [Mycobacterium xenopi 4042]